MADGVAEDADESALEVCYGHPKLMKNDSEASADDWVPQSDAEDDIDMMDSTGASAVGIFRRKSSCGAVPTLSPAHFMDACDKLGLPDILVELDYRTSSHSVATIHTGDLVLHVHFDSIDLVEPSVSLVQYISVVEQKRMQTMRFELPRLFRLLEEECAKLLYPSARPSRSTLEGYFTSIVVPEYRRASRLDEVPHASLADFFIRLALAASDAVRDEMLYERFHFLAVSENKLKATSDVHKVDHVPDVIAFMEAVGHEFYTSHQKSRTTSAERIVKAVHLATTRLTQHCYICGRVSPGIEPHICRNEFCKFKDVETPATCDLFSELQRRGWMLETLFDIALEALRSDNAAVLFSPVPMGYQEGMDEGDVAPVQAPAVSSGPVTVPAATAAARPKGLVRLLDDLTMLRSVINVAFMLSMNSMCAIEAYLDLVTGQYRNACHKQSFILLLWWLLKSLPFQYVASEPRALPPGMGETIVPDQVKCIISVVDEGYEQMQTFYSKAHTMGTEWFIHGSATSSLFSIMKIGLQVLSNTKYMKHGAGK
jgi:hypothetical protein